MMINNTAYQKQVQGKLGDMQNNWNKKMTKSNKARSQKPLWVIGNGEPSTRKTRKGEDTEVYDASVKLGVVIWKDAL